MKQIMKQNNITERMKELGLPFIAASFESFLSEEAGRSRTFVESVSAMLDIEYTARKERTARTRIKLSGMPQMKSLENFDLSWLKGGLSQSRLSELSSLSFIDRKENVIFLGPSGVGKTHLLLALGHKACVSGYSAYYISARDLIDSLLRARETGRLKRRLSWLKKPHLLLVDEVGYEPLSAEQSHVFFQFVNTRYENGSVVMTSNKSFTKWAELMSDEAAATAILDRLLHHSHVFSLKADSYRMKDKLKVGMVNFD